MYIKWIVQILYHGILICQPKYCYHLYLLVQEILNYFHKVVDLSCIYYYYSVSKG
ncbi:hypothetical protein BRC2024_KCUCJSVR_CDS_0177 [Acinetobacter phage vB_AbaM_KissB]